MEFEVFECFEKHIDFDKIENCTGVLKRNRYHVLRGGRGGGKSIFIAKSLVLEAFFNDVKILCTRELQNSISDSVMALLWEQIQTLGLEWFFTETKTEIVGNNGSRFFFRGLKTNVTSIKSIAKIDFVWVEEAESVSEDSWSVLTPSIRTDGARIIITFNPRMLLDSTYQRFVVHPPSDCISTVCNYLDNPRFPKALDIERRDMEISDPDLYEHVWLGKPVGDSPLSIIPPKWARACIDIHKKIGIEPNGDKSIGFDVSGGGKDPNANVLLDGQVVTFIDEFRQTDPVSAALDSWNNATRNAVSRFVFDVIGVGSGTEQTLKEPAFEYKKLGTGEINIIPFDAGGSIENPKGFCPIHNKPNASLYSNLKAQKWWWLRYRCQQSWLASQGMPHNRDAILSFDSDLIAPALLDKLIFEMSAPQREYLGSKLRVEPKDKLLKRGVPSHNLADALIMSDYRERTSSLSRVLAARKRRRESR